MATPFYWNDEGGMMNDEEAGIVSVPHSSFILIHLIGCYNIASLFRSPLG
jgi:hypothetical protein